MESIKILLVEDESIEALDIKRSLEIFGYQVPYIASRGEEAVEKAREILPDIILMDIVLKGDINGIDAAHQIKELGIPIIYLTAHSEESTIERAKLTEPYGYIIKPYDRTDLKHAIELALYKNKMEKQLKDSEDKFRRLAENSRDLIYRMSVPDGKYQYISPASESIFGISPKEFIDFEGIMDFVHPDYHQYFNESWENLQKGIMPDHYEYKIITKKGKEKWLNQRNTLIKDDKGNPIAIEGIVTDITKRKETEDALKDSEERYRMLFENSQICTGITTLQGNVITANSPFFKMTGYRPDEVSQIDLRTMYNDINQRNTLIKILKEQGTVEDFEVKMVRKDGEQYIASINVDLINYDDEPAMMVTAIDITNKFESERKLRQSEKKYRNLYSTMNEGVAVHHMIYDENGQPLDYQIDNVNPAYEEILDIKSSKILGKNASDIYGMDYPPYLDIYAKVADTGKPTQFETYYEPMDKFFNISVFSPSKGTFATIFEDISERKMAEKRLKSSNRLYSTLSQINQALVKIRDVDNLYKTICKISVDYGGFTMAWVGIIDPESGEIQPKIYYGAEDGYLDKINLNIKEKASMGYPSIQAVKSGELIIIDNIEKELDRSWRDEALQRNYRSMASMPLRFKGKIIGIFNLYAPETGFFTDKEMDLVQEMALDISFSLDSISLQHEHKKFEEALKKSEKNYRELVDNSMVAVYKTSLEGEILFANQAMADMFKYPSVDVLKKINVIELYWDHNNRKKVINKLKENRSFSQLEIKGISYNNEPINILLSASLTDKTISGMMMNITDRKRAESELKESEERYAETLEAVNDGIWDWNVAQGTAYFSPTYYTMLGYNVGEFPASYESFVSLLHPDERESIERKLKEYLDKAEGYAIEFRLKTRDNKWKWILSRGRVVETDEKGRSLRMLGTHTNITTHKQVQKALIESETRYQDLFSSVPVGLGVLNLNGILTDANKALENITGYTINELKSTDLFNYFKDPKDLEYVIGVMEGNGRISDYEVRFRRKNGEIYYALLNCELIDLEGDKVILVAVRDISISKKLDKELKDSEQKFKTVADHTFDWEYWIAPDGKLIYVSPSCERISGYNPDEFVNNPSLLEDITHPDDLYIIKDHHLGEYVSEIKTQYLEFRITTKNGEERWLAHVCLPVYDDDGNFLGRRASNRDITVQKKAELDVQKSLHEKELLLREIHHRVKNNLQIISSLLHLQEIHLEDPEFVNILKESEGRVKSMAMIHEKLYQSPTLTQINIKEYIYKLVYDILTSYGIRDDQLKVKLDIEEINLNIDSAIPLGLIINELVTNSVKYAFPHCKGSINIQLIPQGNELELIVADDGVGLPEEISPDNTATLGLQLVNTLIDQIDGDYEIVRSQGTKYIIKFSEIEYKERI